MYVNLNYVKFYNSVGIYIKFYNAYNNLNLSVTRAQILIYFF